MAFINLSSYKLLQSNLFVRIDVEYYKQYSYSAPEAKILTFSDRRESVTIDEQEYIGLGNFMGITSSQSELRASSSEVTITISGIPNTSLFEIINSKIKGSPVKIYRCLFNAETNEMLDVPGNPLNRFQGYVNNYSLQEDWDNGTRTATNTIVLVCSSKVDLLTNKVTGRRTNPEDQAKFYPGDKSMDRVPSLIGANFDFGATS